MKNSKKKLIKILVTISVMTSTYATPLFAEAYTNYTDSNYEFVTELSVDEDEVKEVKNISVKRKNKINFEENTVVDLGTVSRNNILKNKTEILKNIKGRKVFGIFDKKGIKKSVIDKELDLPIQISLSGDMDGKEKIVARFYYIDKENRIAMCDIVVPETSNDKEIKKIMFETINDFIADNKSKENKIAKLFYVKSSATANWVAAAAYTLNKSSSPYGKLYFTTKYDVAKDTYSRDYYAVQGIYRCQPGYKAYRSTWLSDKIETRMRVDYPQSTANIEETCPDNVAQTAVIGGGFSIGGSIGKSPSIDVSGTFYGEKEISDIDSLDSTRISSREHLWTMEIDEGEDFSEVDIAWKPSMIFNTPSSATYANIYVGTNFQVDSDWGLPVGIGRSVNATIRDTGWGTFKT